MKKPSTDEYSTGPLIAAQTGDKNDPECQTPMESDLLDPYEKLVDILILGQRVQVPEKNRLLRCFQYLKMDSVSVGDYCWNGECTNCQIWYETENGEVKSALACRLYVWQGMVITALSDALTTDLRD